MALWIYCCQAFSPPGKEASISTALNNESSLDFLLAGFSATFVPITSSGGFIIPIGSFPKELLISILAFSTCFRSAGGSTTNGSFTTIGVLYFTVAMCAGGVVGLGKGIALGSSFGSECRVVPVIVINGDTLSFLNLLAIKEDTIAANINSKTAASAVSILL